MSEPSSCAIDDDSPVRRPAPPGAGGRCPTARARRRRPCPSVSTFGVSANAPPEDRTKPSSSRVSSSRRAVGPGQPGGGGDLGQRHACGGRRRSRRGRRAPEPGPRRNRARCRVLPSSLPPGVDFCQRPEHRASSPPARCRTRPCTRCTGTGCPGRLGARAARGTCPAATPPRRAPTAGSRPSPRPRGAPAARSMPTSLCAYFTTRPSTSTVCTSPRWAWNATWP